MARYIDADKMQVNCLKDKKFVFAMENPYTQEEIIEIVYKDFLDFLNEQPTADVVEVVHGEWICLYDEVEGITNVTCSVCKSTREINGCYVTNDDESCYYEDDYCPNCGAKMDGKKVE